MNRQRDVVGTLLRGVGDENMLLVHFRVRMRLHNGFARSAYYGRRIVLCEIGRPNAYNFAGLPNRCGARLANRRVGCAAVGEVQPRGQDVTSLAGVLAIDYPDIEDDPGTLEMPDYQLKSRPSMASLVPPGTVKATCAFISAAAQSGSVMASASSGSEPSVAATGML
jgi:hypothetical protein